MRKITVVFMSVLMLAGSGLFAGSLDYLSNQSAKFLMNMSRNASTDSADIVHYNPAGAARLPKGLSVDLSGQTLFKYYDNEDTRFGLATGISSLIGTASLPDTEKTLSQDYPTPVLPNLYLAYNFGEMGPGKLAAYLQVGIVAGGGELQWKNGTAGTTLLLSGIAIKVAGNSGAPLNGYAQPVLIGNGIKSQEFTASSIYYGIGVGAAYAFLDDMVSVSLGCRTVMAQRSFELEATYGSNQTLSGKYEYDAMGFTPIIGINVKPTKELTLAARFEVETALEFEYKQKKLNSSNTTLLLPVATGTLKNSGIEDGKKTRQDLPHIIGLGANYKVNDELTVDLSGTIYMLSNANLGHVYDSATGNKAGKVNEYFGTGWEVGLGATYKVIKELKVGIGCLYTESGAKKSYLNDIKTAFNASANPLLDSIAVGLGANYAVLENLDVTLSLLGTHYLPENFSLNAGAFKVSGKYAKDVIDIAYGVSYKL